MTVYTFLEIDVKGQIEELRSYLKSHGAEISLEMSAKGIEDDLQKIIGVCNICFTANIKEEDVQHLMNSIVSVLIVIPVGEKTESLILVFCEKLANAPEKFGPVCLKVLNLLFQALSENLGVRYNVFYTMVIVSGKIGQVNYVYQSIDKLKAMLHAAQPPPSTEQMQQLLRVLHGALISNKMGDAASEVMLELLGTYTAENASQAKEDARRCIIASVSDPNTYIMDHLLSLKPVEFLEGEVIHNLLVIFVEFKLPDYMKFYKKFSDIVNKHLDHKANIEKMRLLTFIHLAERMDEMTFELLQQELDIDKSEVEAFIIRALKTRLVYARIDQNQEKIYISSVTQRTFGNAEWVYLKETFLKWKSNLALVKDSMETIVTAPLTPA